MKPQFNYLFLSDLHLSEGVSHQTGKIHRNEDFFHDEAFARFLTYHARLSLDERRPSVYQMPWKLVINGDIFDFLQVVSMPPIVNQEAVMEVMNAAGREVTRTQELTPNKIRYGLGTSEPEIVWRLQKIYEGHPVFFQALAWFVAAGHHVVLMKGNHDVELFWPAVQTKMHHILVDAYTACMDGVTAGLKQPFVKLPDMPDQLSVTEVATAVTFPSTYYYEEGVFFASHGCQYDPSNWFPNFADPRLPDNKEYLELPFGSLFVRYFFNSVEAVHPFADNIKPMSRYVFWLLRNSPSSIVLILTTLLPQYIKAVWKVREKTGMRSKENRQTPQNAFEAALFPIQKSVRQGLLAGSKKTTVWVAFSVLMNIIAVILLLNSLRLLIADNFVWMGINLAGAILSNFLGAYLRERMEDIFSFPFLFEAAQKVCHLLNSDVPDTFTAVPYHIFGHDHNSKIERIEIEEGTPHPGFPQWYVNTGTWGSIFSEEDRLLRTAEQLTFFHILTKKLPTNDPPELLHWSPTADRPQRVRLFE